MIYVEPTATMAEYAVICRDSACADIKRLLAGPYAAIADYVLTLCGVDANAKLGHHAKRDEPRRWPHAERVLDGRDIRGCQGRHGRRK